MDQNENQSQSMVCQLHYRRCRRKNPYSNTFQNHTIGSVCFHFSRIFNRLERVISEQNITIEKLTENLNAEKENLQSFKKDEIRRETLRRKEQTRISEEINAINDLLFENGILEASQEGFNCFKDKFKEDLDQIYAENINDLKLNHRKEIETLKNHYEDSFKTLAEGKGLKDFIVEKQVQLLSDTILKLNSTCQILNGVWDPRQYDNQIEQLNRSLDAIRRNEKELSPVIASLSQRLIESVRCSTDVWNEFRKVKTEYLQLQDQFRLTKKKLEQFESASAGGDFVNLEHSVDVCNHDRLVNYRAKTNIGLSQEQTSAKTNIGLSQEQLGSNTTSFNEVPQSENNSFLDYPNKFKKYLSDMLGFYTARIHRYTNLNDNRQNVNLNLPKVEDLLLEPEINPSKSNRVATNIEECHRLLFCLNEMLKSFDVSLDRCLKDNKRVKDELNGLKRSHQEKMFSLESHFKNLDERIVACLSDNKVLENNILQLQLDSVPKENFDKLLFENRKLSNLNKELEEELIAFKEKEVKIDKEMAHSQNVSKEIPETEENASQDCIDDSSATYESLELKAVTSTPFHCKSGDCKTDSSQGYELLKTSLFEWINRCQNVESDNKILRKKLFKLNFNFQQINFNKEIAEQEINILKDNVHNLENKLSDYISLKENCHKFENDNTILTIKLKYLNEMQDRPILLNSADSNVPLENFHFDFTSILNSSSSFAKLNLINEFQKMNQKIVNLESKCRTKDFNIEELSIRLRQSKEIEKKFEKALQDLISDNNFAHSKLFSLVDENVQLNSFKHAAEIELISVKDQMKYLISTKNYDDTGNESLLESMKKDALKFLKDSLDKWFKVERSFIDNCVSSNQVERLDARHRVEILLKNNNLLKNDKDDLLLKISELQHTIHTLMGKQDIDGVWFVQMDKNDRELLKELKEQREQQSRIEEALRSTAGLYDELQKQCDLHGIKLREIASLQKLLEEEKLKSKNYESRLLLIENELKEKKKILEETLEAKKSCEMKLVSIEKEFIHKEKKFHGELMRAKWSSLFSQNRSIDSMVRQSMSSIQIESLLGLSDREKNYFETMDSIYQQSIDSLRYAMQQDKAACLAELSVKHNNKLRENVLLFKNQIIKDENSELKQRLAIVAKSDNELSSPHKESVKDFMNTELSEIENLIKQSCDSQIFLQFKTKLQEFYDQDLLLSISQLKEEHKQQSEISFNTLNELHNEEMTILKLKMEAEKNAELYNLTQDQLKREKNLMNSITQSEINSHSSAFYQFKISIIKLFLKYVRMFLPMWEKAYNKSLESLETKYQQFLTDSNLDESTDDVIEIETAKEIENIICNQSLVVDNSRNFVDKLEQCLTNLLNSANKFFKNNCDELNDIVKMLKTSDCPENIAALHQKIENLVLEKNELEEKHKAAIQLLVSDHEEELLKIRHLVESLTKIESVEQDEALSKYRSDLEEKHTKEVEELRTYFERKCAELEKHYSEEIMSHHSRKMSIVSSSSESEMISEENSLGPTFHATLILTDECLGQIPEGTNLLTELYSDHDVESGLLVERYFVDLNAMDQVLLKHKLVVDRVVSYWKTRLEMLYSNLERKYSDRLESDINNFKDTEEKVQSILSDVKEESTRELEWLNSLQTADILEQSLRLEIEKHYENKISRIIDDYEDRLVKETLNLTQMYKKRELEAVWGAKVESEQSYRQEIQSIESKWEKRYVSDMASFISDRSLEKVRFEGDIRNFILSFNKIISEKFTCLQEKFNYQLNRLDSLQNKAALVLKENSGELERVKELCNIEKEVMQKNCNNIINQMQIDTKQSCDVLISMYENDLARLAEAHEEEMKLAMEKHNEQISQLKAAMKEIPTINEEEVYDKAREIAVNHVVEHIVDFISKEEENNRDGSDINLPPEFSGLENYFKSKYKKILDEQTISHREELERLKQQFSEQVNRLNKITSDETESDSSKSVNLSLQCGPGCSDEINKLLKERDALKKLTDSLKSAVGQLSSYLHSCEDEVNRTVVEQLLRAATSTENSPIRISSGGSLRRVHFAPDVSRILETTYEDCTSTDISCLDDPNISAALKHELDTCLSKLRKEATAILGLSVNNRPAVRSLPAISSLGDMARTMLSDKTSPNADIMNIIDVLTLEGDNLIEELQHEKEDLQQQIFAADSQLKSTRKFLEDQAVEREAERDEYSRELSLLHAHIKQTTPDTRHQTLTMEVEDLEKQVKDTANNLKDAETRKKELEEELKDTVEKVWVLTDIITKLENQILVKSEREECLEKKLDELEAELEQQSIAQQAMVQEMESLKSRDESEGNYMEQIAALQEELKSQYSSNCIRNIKAQLRDIEKGIESRTKELDGLNLHSSTTSLSSPSEEISIREHLEMMRCQTPEFCPSPVALPVDEVNKLQDKIHRHIRSEEMIIKKVKDQDIQIKKLSLIIGEIQAEREALQQTVDKLNSQLNRANTKVDDLRRKAETAQNSTSKALSEKISQLEEEAVYLKHNLDEVQTTLLKREDQLKHAKELIDDQNIKLRNLSQSDPSVVKALNMELASVMMEKNKLHELVEKLKSEAEMIDMSPLYSCLLNDKNEDIQQLQQTLSLLQSQAEKESDNGPSVIGKTVSFVDQISPLVDSLSPIRDAPRMHSFPLPSQTHEFDKTTGPVASTAIQLDECEARLSSFHLNQSLSRSDDDEKVLRLESEVKSLQSLVSDLTDAKKDVESYISSFTDDRKYYESHLNKLLDEKKSQEDEIDKLRQTINKKDNEIKNTTADVNKLQVILCNLQENLKQASKHASKDNQLKKELSDMKEKCSTLEDALERFYQFRDELETLNEDFISRENNSYDYFQNILETLRQKLRKSTDIEMSNNNLKHQLDGLKTQSADLKQVNEQLRNEIISKKEIYESEISSLKSTLNEINKSNIKLANEVVLTQQLKEDNVDLASKIEKLELSKNLMEVELNSLKSENNKLFEELECIRTELKFRKVNSYEDISNEKDVAESAPAPQESEHVADLEDLTYEIEKQLDLSAKLDNSLLNTIGDKSGYKKGTTTTQALPTSASSCKDAATSISERSIENQSDRGLVSWLAKEVEAWQSAGAKQNQLTSQLNNLSRLVQTQDNRITRLLVELDDKKKECLVMELDLLRERSNLKQTQCLLETERQRARSIQKEDTHLIETLRIRLEAALKAESSLKSLLVEERQKHETLEACLNSARALENYVQSSSESESSQTVRNQLVLRMEVDRLKQLNGDLESVITRERNAQIILKDKIKFLKLQIQSSEKRVEEVVFKLNEETKLRESAENELRHYHQNFNNAALRNEKDVGACLAMENVLSEIKLWKDECLQLRDCIRLQREHEDYWVSNVQTPLIKQLNDVNRSLESLVREKITLQTYVACIEKERDFLRTRVDKLEELNEKLSGNNNRPLSPQISAKMNLQSVLNKLQYLADLNHKMDCHRKALIWQKRYLMVAVNGYQKSTMDVIDRLNPEIQPHTKTRTFSFRIVVHVIRACIKLNYIHKRREAYRAILVNKMKAEINLPSTSKGVKKSTNEVLSTNSPNCMSLSPPSRDLYALPRFAESLGQGSMDSEPSKLTHYVQLFDKMQERLGKIIQNDNL